MTSTEQDQKELAVTVYNSNVALVRDVRRVRLPDGTIDLRYMDIAAQVNPATVHIVSLTAPKELNVLEQDYEYDLLSPQKLLQKYVGKELTLVRVIAGKQFHQGSSRCRPCSWRITTGPFGRWEMRLLPAWERTVTFFPTCRKTSTASRRWSGCWTIATRVSRRWRPLT